VLFSRQKGLYDQIRYLDASGGEIIRVNYNGGHPASVPEKALQSKATRYYFIQTRLLDRGEVFVSPFDLNVEHDEIERPFKPVIRVATPVFDRQGTKRGVLVLNYLGSALIQKLTEVAVSFPGSAWLLNQDGFFLHGPTPEDEWGFMLSNQGTFATYYPEEWQSLVQADSGQFVTANGLFTFRTLSPRAQIPRHRQAPASSHPDPDAAAAELKVVSYIPGQILWGGAAQSLRRMLFLYGAAIVVVLALTWYLVYASVLRRDQERQIAASEGRLRTLSTRLITAQEDERRSLSRDLHDELGQLATAVSLDLQRAAQSDDRDKKNDLLGRALDGTDCLLNRIHELSTRVRPTLLDDLGLKEAVQSYVSEYERHTGIVARTDLRFETASIPAVVSENLYRILQEALTNVAKHARTAEVLVALHAAAHDITLSVRDEGIGFAPEALNGKRLGLLGMRERAELLNGSFIMESQAGKGTLIQVRLPLST
jgi:signal transduction histidine kinase